jgi:hypothetical protein
MRKLIVPLALLALGVLLAAAVAIDCVRLAHDAYYRVELADAEMVKNEIRLVKQMEGRPKIASEVQASIEKVKSSRDRKERIAAYDLVIAAFRNSSSAELDPNNILDRKFTDEAAGAMNRRDVAQKQYDAERAAYEAYMNSWRGRIAAIFSPTPGADSRKTQR